MEIFTRIIFVLYIMVYCIVAPKVFDTFIDAENIKFIILILVISCLFAVQDYIEIYRVDKFIKETLGGVKVKKKP